MQFICQPLSCSQVFCFLILANKGCRLIAQSDVKNADIKYEMRQQYLFNYLFL